MSFATEIRNVRMKAFLTQEEFSKVLSVSSITVNRWETGQALPRVKAMKNIKEFCEKNGIPYDGVEHEWLLK